MSRAILIKYSLRAFVYAWFAFLPLLGTGFWVAAVINLRRSRLNNYSEWNPGQHYRKLTVLLLVVAFPVCLVGTVALLNWIFA